MRTARARFVLCLIAATVLQYSASAVSNDRPNIVFINLDDADRDMFRASTLDSKFPAMADLASRGMTFTQFYVCTAKCGPSRASLLRGQYAHAINHRTNEFFAAPNRGFTGGFENFVAQGFYDNDFGRWMKQGGYETVFVGKYLNGTSQLSVPAGWDHFYLSRGSDYYLTHRYTNRVPSRPRTEVTAPGIYRTDAEVNDIVRIINNDLSQQKPFMLYFAPFGPHTEGKAPGGMVAEALADKWPNVKPPRQADFNEKNNSDKPLVYRQLPPLTFEDELAIQVEHRKRMLAVKSIDNGIRRIVDALKFRGLYHNTYFFITSDNGFSLGQHRVSGKGKSLSRSTHVPLIVSGPRIPRGSLRATLASQIDLAPTFLELAGLPTKSFFDGKSLAPVLFGGFATQPNAIRDSLLVENWEKSTAKPYVFKTTFCQLRTPTESYTQWADGTQEYYNIADDPLELHNRANRLTRAQIDAFQAEIALHRRPMPSPISTFESPVEDFDEMVGPPFAFTGLAEDSSGIRKVDLVIRNLQTKEYWNGNDWQAERAAVQPVLGNPGGIQTEWSYDFTPTEPENPKESYVAIARAFANSGTFSQEVAKRRIKYDSLAPVSIQKNPRVRANKTVVLWGTSSDNWKLKRTELIIQDLDTKRYFDGQVWTVGRRTIKVTSDEEGNWEWVGPNFPSGRYVSRSRAVDFAGNFEPLPQVERFTVD